MPQTEFRLRAGALAAVLRPAGGMTVASLAHAGEELLHTAAEAPTSTGIALLYPWANRLAVPCFEALGKRIALDPSSTLLQRDANGLLNHGMRSAALAFHVLDAAADRLVAELAWSAAPLYAVFPFRHRIRLCATLVPAALTIETTLVASEPMPVCFGFHPNLRVPGLPRERWRLVMPARQRLLLDARRIPTTERTPVTRFDAELGALDLDAAYAVSRGARFALAGAGRRLTVELLENFPYAQVYAPCAQGFIAIEPMTAPANALVSGMGWRSLAAGETFRATFRIGVAAEPTAPE